MQRKNKIEAFTLAEVLMTLGIIGIVAAFNGAYRSVKGYLKNEESPGQRARRLEEEAESQSGDKHD